MVRLPARNRAATWSFLWLCRSGDSRSHWNFALSLPEAADDLRAVVTWFLVSSKGSRTAVAEKWARAGVVAPRLQRQPSRSQPCCPLGSPRNHEQGKTCHDRHKRTCSLTRKHSRIVGAKEYLEALMALPPYELEEALDNFAELLDILWEWNKKDLEDEQESNSQEEISEPAREVTGCPPG